MAFDSNQDNIFFYGKYLNIILMFQDNPVRAKPGPKQGQQPLVTQQMLQSTRAKLGRARPVAASTPKQQLSELEKWAIN